MSESPGNFTLYGKPPLFQLFFALIVILTVGMILFFGLLRACTLIPGVDWTALLRSISDGPGQSNIALLRIMVIVQDFSLFIIPGIIIMSLMRQRTTGFSLSRHFPSFTEIVIVVFLAFCIFPVTSWTGHINSAMHLPDGLSGIEKWMIQKEDQADNVIDMLINSQSTGVMTINLFIVAVLPAVGEELIFRGVFQRIFTGLFRSGHLAVWFTAFLFSTLHFQFFGFIPRFILGLVFGYLFFWGGTIWLPVISHFVNNAFPVVLTYFQNSDTSETTVNIPFGEQTIVVSLSAILIILILLYFRNKRNKQEGINPSQ